MYRFRFWGDDEVVVVNGLGDLVHAQWVKVLVSTLGSNCVCTGMRVGFCKFGILAARTVDQTGMLHALGPLLPPLV